MLFVNNDVCFGVKTISRLALEGIAFAVNVGRTGRSVADGSPELRVTQFHRAHPLPPLAWAECRNILRIVLCWVIVRVEYAVT